jgi:hypothetical protein
VLKPSNPGVSAAEEKPKTDVITTRDNKAPETEAAGDENEAKKGFSSAKPARRARNVERARPNGSPERKIGGKRFWLSGDIWMDREFNPDKEIPVVTVARDSEAYRQLMEKYPALKLYFTNFADDQRAIIVYKKIAYRLVPRQ